MGLILSITNDENVMARYSHLEPARLHPEKSNASLTIAHRKRMHLIDREVVHFLRLRDESHLFDNPGTPAQPQDRIADARSQPEP